MLERAIADFLSRRTYSDSLASAITERLGEKRLREHYREFTGIRIRRAGAGRPDL
jgi:hypothetical protein